MYKGFAAMPAMARFVLQNARVPRCLLPADLAGAAGSPELADVDILIQDGRVAGVLPAGGALPPDVARVALDAGIVLPAFVDSHTHLDKGHIWARRPNPDGSFPAALEAVGQDREANWSAQDVARRMDFALRCAFAHGTAAIRTHLDSIGKQTDISWDVFGDMRERWAGRITLQAAALTTIDRVTRDDEFMPVFNAVRRHRGVLGAVTFMVPELDAGLDRMFRLAAEHGLDLDFHVDETNDPTACSLRHIAQASIRHGFAGKILAGHCCSIALQEPGEIDRTLDLVAQAGIAVVSLPMCNMYLQDRTPGRTPRWRGVTLLHEMKARGIPVMVASDNTRDPFYAYGDLDVVEVLRAAVRIAHLDHPFGDWPAIVAATPAEVMRLPGHGRIAPGATADLVLTRARTLNEFVARPQSDRTVLRNGRAIDITPPDYRELDDLMGAAL